MTCCSPHDVPVFSAAARLKALWGCPLICDLHEIFPEQDQHFTTATAKRYWRTIEGAGLAAADGIIGCNEAVADYAREHYRPAVPVVAVHNAVPYMDESSRRAGPTLRDYYGIPASPRIMVFVGSLRLTTGTMARAGRPVPGPAGERRAARVRCSGRAALDLVLLGTTLLGALGIRVG